MKYGIIWCTSLILFLFGCAAGTKFTVSEPINDNVALLYVFRGSSSPLLLKPTIYINDMEVVDLSHDSYIDITLKPGTYNIKSKWSRISGVVPAEKGIDVEAEPGKTYYLYVATSLYLAGFTTGPLVGGKQTLEFVDVATALPILKECEKAEKRDGIEKMIIPKGSRNFI